MMGKLTQELLVNEYDVQRFYENAIARHCMAMALTLVCEGNGNPIFRWSKKSADKEAIADGILSLNIPITSESLQSLPTTLQDELKLLTDWHLDTLLIWEFKSLSVGNIDLMNAIRNLPSQGTFPWTACLPTSSCDTPSKHKPHEPIPIPTGRRTGPDCQPPIMRLPETRKRFHHDTVSVDHAPDMHPEERLGTAVPENKFGLCPAGAPSMDAEINLKHQGGTSDLKKGQEIMQQVGFPHGVP
ncbi:uncharacterized protein LACBIDRAFT_297885 [Laccaria bicolor S238N-H82]|uniref:Predicted protein n=1 Tax=Laccaria bicolor (strain S238N-H82 / ATCC MYA-4686) TaxID=486041 RepID=B0DB43_LACBS|nr:uncharacterized protein LACBIDRAFT_297885 [Laccaria bicolor S238N-H82]EDR08323.1 predicted protein [Laccaria bicolor S238N-H82]|eukprot:XP_001881393.1 predicted protein [Laccaria bicolor S238N-H82]